ncbi:alpha/beta fold hydrolase [Haloglomus halophilum]|uniref:alpha/beta fold hydrolase n=1 Tax=Haloglomus halophilum TaxID=2962672 RepID=UPI0020CA0DF6|nr:alpha/beta hydrolase [Haloglomus halophilum]
MDHVTHDGRTTAYRDAPADTDAPAPTVLYVHGSGGTHSLWANQYGRPDHDAVALDLSGHGESEDVDLGPEAGLDVMTAYAEDTVAVARETDATVLCGNSLGGAVALTVALESDLDLDGLVLVGTGAKLGVADELLDALANDYDAAVETLLGEDMLYHAMDDERRVEAREMFRAVGQRATERDFRSCDAFDVRDRLGEIDVPALVCNGEHDSLTPPAFHEYLAEHLPDARHVELADAAHMPYLERPAAFDAAVDEFLDELAA